MKYIVDLRKQESHHTPEVDKRISTDDDDVTIISAFVLSLVLCFSNPSINEKLNSSILDNPAEINSSEVNFSTSSDSIIPEVQKTDSTPDMMLANFASETAGSTSSALNTDNYEFDNLEKIEQPAASKVKSDAESISKTVTVSAQVLSEISCNELGCTSNGKQMSSSTKNGITTYSPSI